MTAQLNVPAAIRNILGISYIEGEPADEVVALLSLIEQVGKEIIGEDEKLKILDTFRDHKVLRNSLRAAQRQRLATILGKEK